jgi:hypothetical protein
MVGESDQNLISALKRGHLNIHCSRMELAQNTSHQPVRYVGSGYIRQNGDGGIEFTIYATEIYNVDVVTTLYPFFGGQHSGTVFHDDESYELTAKSYCGYEWTTERIFDPSVDWRQTPQRVSGNIRILRREGKAVIRDRPHRIIMHFFKDIDIPCPTVIEKTSRNLDGAVFDAVDGRHFRIQKLVDEIVVDIRSEVPFPPYFDVRVVEALSYVLAHSMSWRTLNTYNGDNDILELSSPHQQSTNPKLGRPLLANQLAELPMAWRLFGKYLEYVTRENTTPSWHTCSYYAHYACEASASSLEAWTIGLCVAVEKIAGLVNYVEPSADIDQTKKTSRLVRKWLKSKRWSDTRVGKRANGLLSMLNNPRVKDRLDALAKLGNVDPTHIKIWGKLRNPSVHAGESNVGETTTKSSQEWLDSLGAVTVLMYNLTFYLIGYAESYTDYSKPGWTSARYPLSAREVAGSAPTSAGEG